MQTPVRPVEAAKFHNSIFSPLQMPPLHSAARAHAPLHSPPLHAATALFARFGFLIFHPFIFIDGQLTLFADAHEQQGITVP